jgi:hypothetical protein
LIRSRSSGREQFQRRGKTRFVDAEVPAVIREHLADSVLLAKSKTGGIDDAELCLCVFVFNFERFPQIAAVNLQ